jgi:hypothetical protein
MDFLNYIPVIGPAIRNASDFLFGSDDEFYSTEDGFISRLFSGGKSSSSSRQMQAVGQALGVVDKKLTKLNLVSRDRAMREATKNLQRELPTSVERKKDERRRYTELAKLPIVKAAQEGRLESAIAHYQNQLRRNGMSGIPDQSVTISDEAPRYTKSPTAIG